MKSLVNFVPSVLGATVHILRCGLQEEEPEKLGESTRSNGLHLPELGKKDKSLIMPVSKHVQEAWAEQEALVTGDV